MDLLQSDAEYLITFLLILTRVSGIFFLAPILGNRNIPYQIKIGLSLITAIILAPFIPSPNISSSTDMIELAMLIAKELSVGAIIGFTATLIFMGFLVAGQIIDFQMGFSMMNVLDPLSNVTVTVMGQFKNVLAILIFLAINGHHFLFSALARSFSVVPLTTFAFTPSVMDNFINLVVNMFIVGLQIGAPAIGVLFLTELAMGIIARTVPQMNVFIVGLPLKIIVGFTTVILTLSFFSAYVINVFNQMPEKLLQAIK